MTEEDKVAAGYLKLQEDVKSLILKVVEEELTNNQYGVLASRIKRFAVDQIDTEIKLYRMGKPGQTIPY